MTQDKKQLLEFPAVRAKDPSLKVLRASLLGLDFPQFFRTP